MKEKGFIQRSILIWILVIFASASVPFGISMRGPENAKIMTGNSYKTIDERLFTIEEMEERYSIDQKEKEWREWIEKERKELVVGGEGDYWDNLQDETRKDLNEIKKISDAIKEKEDAKKREEERMKTEKERRKYEELSRSKELEKAKQALIPRLSALVNQTFGAGSCREKMELGSEINEFSLKEFVENYIDKVCKEGDDHQSYLEEKIFKLETISDLGEFNYHFDRFFRDFENSVLTFEQFIRSEIRRLINLVREETKKIEEERYRIRKETEERKNPDCSDIEGMSIFGFNNGEYEFIGSIANVLDPNSIANDFGAGNKLKLTSIFNEFGKYGDGGYRSSFSTTASEPPVIVDRNYNFIGYLSLNEEKSPYVTPYKAFHCARESFRFSIIDHEHLKLKRWVD